MAKQKSTYEKTGAPELSRLTGWLDFAEDISQKQHWEWFVIDQFLRGNHNVRGNPQDNSIEVGQRIEQVNFPINQLYSTFRAVRSFVTRNKPKIEVEPDETMDDNGKTYARQANQILERDNKLNNGRRLNKEWVYYGVKYGVGWRQIGYDVEKKVTQRWTIDPFDLLLGSKIGKLEDSPYVIKSLIRTVGYWKNKYPDKNVVADNEVAADQYKKLSIQITSQNMAAGGQGKDEETAIGYECWYRLYKPNKYGGLINKCLFTRSDILAFEETPFTEYPFIPYEAEIKPNEAYPEGHLKHIIAPQRLLNLLNTQLVEYNHIVNRGRILAQKNSGFQVINAKEGQIIRYNAGKPPVVMNPPALNPLIQWQINFAKEAIQDIGGQQDASMGRLPSSSTSGNAIEALQQGDSNNISDLRDNFEDSLALEASWILKMYSLFEKNGVVLNEAQKQGEQTPKIFGMVGSVATKDNEPMVNPETNQEAYYNEDNGTYCDVCKILPDNQVKVSVISELGETRQARMDLLMKLVEMGLPFKVLLEYLEFPNSGDVLSRIAEESLAEIAMEQMKASMTQQAGPGGAASIQDVAQGLQAHAAAQGAPPQGGQ